MSYEVTDRWQTCHETREAWLLARESVIGGSDVSALFVDDAGKSLNPYKSAYGLWLEKMKLDTQSVEETDAMYWGKVLEPYIATRYGAETGRVISPIGFTICQSADCPYLGTTPDYSIETAEGHEGPGLLSIKNVDLWRFIRQRWDEDEIPAFIQIQLQAELAATGRGWGSFALLVGGNRFRWLDVERNDRFIQVLKQRVVEFKRRLDDRDPPPIDASESTTEALKRLYGVDNGETVKLDAAALELAMAHEQAKADIKALEERKRGLYNQLLATIGSATEARFSDGSGYTLKPVNKSSYTVKAQSYRDLRRKEAK